MDKDDQRLVVKFPADLHRRLKIVAARQGRTMTDVVVEAVSVVVELEEEERVEVQAVA